MADLDYRAMSDEDLIALQERAGTEQGRRSVCATFPDFICGAVKQFAEAGGDLADLRARLTETIDDLESAGGSQGSPGA